MRQTDRETVSIVKCNSYSDDDLNRALKHSLTLLGGISSFIKKGDKVLLKINLLQGKEPQYAVTTHPALLKAVIKEVKKAGGIPVVADNPSAAYMHSFLHAAEVSGLKQVCQETRTELMLLDDPIDVENKNGRVIKTFSISKKLKNFDVIINLPKLKTHALTIYTGAVKNLFGCVPGAKKGFYHVIAQDAVTFSELLLDLNEIIKPNLTIMDGIIGMEGDGPAAGNPRHIGVIIAGTDTIAVDTVSAAVVGIENKIPLLKIAKSRGIKQATLSNIRLVGEPIAAVKLKNFRLPSNPLIYAIPSWGIKLGRTIFAAKPFVDKSLCISCANCEKVCPAEAIAMKNKYPHFDYRKCIRCYCCQESCPKKAIKLKENSLRRLLFLNSGH